jgi:amino-acid N-acetyltransferase
MRIELTTARADALPSVEQLLRTAELPLDGLHEQFPDAYVIARGIDEIVGVAGLERYGDVGLLRSLAVAPAHRSRGTGRLLVTDLLLKARASRLRAVYLLTTTARDYFTRLGFALTPRAEVPAALAASEEFARACPASATCLVWRPEK